MNTVSATPRNIQDRLREIGLTPPYGPATRTILKRFKRGRVLCVRHPKTHTDVNVLSIL